MDAKKLYLVAFSDSKQYTLYADKAEELNVLANIEKELNEYLKTLFPDETFAYFTTPASPKSPKNTSTTMMDTPCSTKRPSTRSSANSSAR